MIPWYLLFMAALLLLWWGAVPADRKVVRIILAATVVSWLSVELVTSRFIGAWKLAIPAAVETGTILCLMVWSRNRSGFKQAACVLAAWFAHVLCFADLRLGTDLIYSNYEAALVSVSAAQLVAFHETYLHHLRRIGSWWSNLGASRPGLVRASGVSAPAFQSPRPPRV